jgi:uncharacterized protein (DUF2267 family)
MTSQTDAGLFDVGVREAHEWIADVARETALDERGALTALRAVLRALRDETTARQNGHLAAEMPTLIRGLFFEGWDPGRPRTVDHDRAGFLNRVRAYAGTDDPGFDVANATRGVFRVLERRIPGPMAQIARMLPRELRALWTPSIAEQTAERHQRLVDGPAPKPRAGRTTPRRPFAEPDVVLLAGMTSCAGYRTGVRFRFRHSTRRLWLCWYSFKPPLVCVVPRPIGAPFRPLGRFTTATR